MPPQLAGMILIKSSYVFSQNSQETPENTKESPKPMAPRSPTEPFRLHGAPHPEIAAILQAHSSMAPFAQRKALVSVFASHFPSHYSTSFRSSYSQNIQSGHSITY